MRALHGLRALTGLLASATLTGPAMALESAPATRSDTTSGPVVEAIWVEKDLAFTYVAFTTYYSCAGLRDKLRWVLREIGARPGFEVRVRGCVQPSGPELLPRVEIRAALPMAATPELLAEIEHEASSRELIARVTGRSAGEATARFPARWRRIRFDPAATSQIEPGDCELVEQLRDAVFVPFGLRLVENSMSCLPKAIPLHGIRLTIEVLEPVPQPVPEQGSGPAEEAPSSPGP